MSIFNKSIKITATSIILFCLTIVTLIIGVGYFYVKSDKILAILGSLFAGLIVAIIQFIISWQDYKETEKLKELKLKKVLYNRNDRTFYEKYIRQSNHKIDMMGVTASRFFNDFADDSPNATSNAKVLIEALSRKVKVRILLPSPEYVIEEKKNDVEKVQQQIKSIKSKYPNYLLEVRYFKHVAAHSIFNVDDECIVGPVFPELESKYTPALYLQSSSPIADKYLTYFENEWEKSK